MTDAARPATATSPPLEPGDPAPWFVAATPGNPHFHFSTCVGRYTLLGFLPSPGPDRDAALRAVLADGDVLDARKLSVFLVLRDAASIAQAKDRPPTVRWFLDADGALSRLYGVLEGSEGHSAVERPCWLLLDPSHRLLRRIAIADTASLTAALRDLPEIADYAGVDLVAPVLILPRVFDADLCRRLMAHYESEGGTPSGVMRDVDGRTVGVLDDFKRRRDVNIADEGLRREVQVRLQRALLPEVAKVFQFQATRIERQMVACYDAADGGYFKAHRDNETLGTAHRRFACTINLNAEAFEGGDLRFPEFGPRTYRAPTGGAVVFCCSLQHEATPVLRGRRYAFLPFFYDEAGQALRDRNAAFLTAPNAPAGADPKP